MEALSRLPCFAGLPTPELALLEGLSRPCVFAAGTMLFHEGDESDSFYVVLAGEVAIVKDVWGSHPLNTLGPGDFFGEMGVVEQAPRCASARAVTDVSLLEIRAIELRELLGRSPTLALRVMATISRRNRQNRSLEEMAWSGKPAAPPRRGQVTAVCSMTGGAGVSTTALNLAHELARQSAGKVILVDASTEFGDLALLLDVVPTGTLASLATNPALEPLAVQRAAIATASGFDLLAAPLRPELGDSLTGDFMRRLLEILRGLYDHVVIDTARSMQDPLPALLEEADDVVYLLTPTLQSIKNARLWRGLLTQMELETGSVKFVVNGAAGSSQSLAPETLAQSLGAPLAGIVPADPDRFAAAADSGAILCKESPGCPAALALTGIAAHLLGRAPAGPARLPSRWRPRWLDRWGTARAPLPRAAGA